MKKMKKYTSIFYFVFFLFLISCEKQVKLKKEKNKHANQISKCEKEQFIVRSELNLFKRDNQNIDSIIIKLENDFPILFQDTSLLKDITIDKNFNIIFDSVYVHFKDMSQLFNIINGGFCILEGFFPELNPKIITMIDDDIVYTSSPPFNPIFYSPENNVIAIQLQWFLGKNHVFYTNRNQPIPEYLTERYHQNFISSMLFHTLGTYYSAKNNKSNELLVAMINEAKPYFFTELMLPELNDSLIFGATKFDIDFFNQNSESVWKYILENQLLFSSESNLKQQFIMPAKKTQIETPGRLGVWIGWQILRSYYNNNDVSLQEILKETNYLKILNKSNYKP